MWFFEGPNNDVVQVCVDALPCTVGHSWEDFYRDGNTNTSRVDRVLFRLHNPDTGDAAQPSHQGNGLFIDNLKLASENYSGAAFSVSGPSTITEALTSSGSPAAALAGSAPQLTSGRTSLITTRPTVRGTPVLHELLRGGDQPSGPTGPDDEGLAQPS